MKDGMGATRRVMPHVRDVRQLFREVRNDPHHRVNGTIEVNGLQFVADEPKIFGEVNENYVARELAWYESMSLDPEDIEGKTPAIWQQIKSTDGLINSNYGYLIWSNQNGNQYQHVLNELLTAPGSRRAEMVYNRPTIHTDAYMDGMQDFICTNAVVYELRGDQLSAIVQMRSNDVVFGYRNDYAWQRYVLSRLVDDINSSSLLDYPVHTGDIVWSAASLHVYSRHWNLIGDDVQEDL